MSIDTLAVVHSVVGRRHQITATEMIAILEDLAAAGADLVNGSTITGRGKDGKLYVGQQWIDDPAEEARATAQAWAHMCRGLTCVSVMPGSYFVGDDLRTGLTVRYDEPGSMHPMQQAELTFVPAECAGDENDTVGYMRRHARRVLLVEPYVEPARQIVPAKVPAWMQQMRKHPHVDGEWVRIHDDGTLEMRDPNHGQRSEPAEAPRFQYRLDEGGHVMRRMLPPECVGDAWVDTGIPEWEPSQTLPQDGILYDWWEAQVL